MQEDKICPYPGLRPFNEEESIFFRGREEHIEHIILQLQEKKFLMLTGASGDGKSSMVYAGIIPNARAGFFKAKFNNWLIADFRPERTPLHNLAVTLTDKLGYKDVSFVEKELGFGFSSLVSLYKKSPFYLDINGADYKNAQEPDQKKLKRKAANLFILVDQFEEFFTNSENYNNGKASVNAQAVVNLLLETAKISLSEDLPIYIVCTMRSDYVGQCASFRGLPEHIGFSQFFVPRLKRKEVHQVIEEPAVLSGNKISNRLIETLINECDGPDQLPILQHALNRIWRAHAEDGANEMDIIHYAKVGGIDRKLLPDDQKEPFEKWYKGQTPFRQKYIEEGASLSNVLNAHARELYENAVDYCRKHIGRDISKQEAHEILKKVFTCLTKINDSRAVRNRATVLEIRQIIGGNVDNKLIEGLVNLFRESDNTLLKPFILNPVSGTEHNTSASALSDNDILDITHESLIRNWTDLTEWTKHDHENVSIVEDLKKQVTRWELKNRSSDYLLTIGSLSYFKNWYVAINPNPYLLAKYDSSNLSPKQKLEDAAKFIPAAKDFIRISETNIKRKRKAVIAIAAAIALVLIGFTSWAFMERNKALEKTEAATRAEMIANESAYEATRSKNMAFLSKEKAVLSEKAALGAKQQAEQSKIEALAAKARAEKAFVEAKQNAELAKSETDRATLALTESEKAKQDAILSKNKAEQAEKDASRISLLSLAQSVALKSELFRADPQLQGLLAYQAYRFTVENNGNVQDPVIFAAIRSSYFSLNKEAATPRFQTRVEQRSGLLLPDNTTFFTADKNGSVYKWDLKAEKILEKGEMNYTVPYETVHFSEWPNILMSGHKNGTICVWDISVITKPVLIKELTGHRGALRAIDFNKPKEMFASAGKDSSVFIWNYKSSGIELLKQIKVNSAVRDILVMPDGNSILLALENGNLAIADVSSGKVNMVFKDRNNKPWSMKLNEQKTVVAVGFSDGKIRLFDPSKMLTAENLTFTFSENSTAVEKIAFNKSGELLAVASADKSIKIFNLTKRNQKALTITDIKAKTRYLLFEKGNQLIVCGSDHGIRKIEPSTEKIAASFCEYIKRNLTQVEWSQNISETLPYQKTCKNRE